MFCEKTQSKINALIDGELNLIQSTLLRRHIEQCEKCASEYQSAVAISRRARRWRTAQVSDELLASIHDYVDANPFKRHGEIKRQDTNAPKRVEIRHKRLASASAFGVAALCVVIGQNHASRHADGVAYADIRNAMSTVAAVSWTQQQTRWDLAGHETLHNTQQMWVRTSPPSIAEIDSASTVPQVEGGEYAGPTHTVFSATGVINCHVRDGVYYIHPPQDIAQGVKSAIDSLTASVAETSSWRSGKCVLDGRPALVFNQHVHEVATLSSPVTMSVDGYETFWADPSTLKVIQKKSDLVYGPKSITVRANRPPVVLPAEHIVVISSGFRYGSNAPAGVFDDAPPRGARTTEDDGKGNKTVVADTQAR